MLEFKQLSDIVEFFKVAGCYLIPGGDAVVLETSNPAVYYGEYRWDPSKASWARVGTRLAEPARAVEWLEFKDGFLIVLDMATKRVTKIKCESGKPNPVSWNPAPPFKAGDWCVAEGIGWAYVPLLIEHDLEYRGGRWWYGNTDVSYARFRPITEADLEAMYLRDLDDANRWSRWAANKIALLSQMLAKKGDCLSRAGTLTVEMEE